ncbi:MAG: CARDB domain-containing protein [Patescibacteria group bacterium]
MRYRFFLLAALLAALTIPAASLAETVPPATGTPDLTVTSDGLSVNKTTIKSGDKITLKAKIKNIGTATAKNVKVRLYFNGSKVYEKTISTISKATGYTTVTYAYQLSENASGPIAFKAIIDPDNAIAESDEKNNESSKDILVQKAARDLYIDYIKAAPAKPKVGQQVTWTIKVRNAGNGKVTGLKLNFYANNASDDPTNSVTINSLSGNAAAVKTFKWTVPANVSPAVGYSVHADVDPDNKFVEDNENNNSKIFSINLTAPDLKIEPGINFMSKGPLWPGVRLAQWGRVRNDNVLPVTGAKVGLYYYAGTNSANPIKLTEQAIGTVPKNGTQDFYIDGVLPASFPIGTVIHVILRVDSTNAVVETDETNNVLETTRTLTERPKTVQYPYLRVGVLDEDGNPKNGVVVKLTNLTTGAVETKTTGVETFYTSLGAVIFESRPDTANYKVEITADGYRPISETFNYDKYIDSTNDRQYYLDKKAQVSGKVTNQSGVALSGVKVRLEGTGLEAVTDSQGKFGFLLNGGSYDFRFIASGYARLSDPGRNIAPLSTIVLDKTLSPATISYISGTATDDDGNPLQNVDVWVNGNLLRSTGPAGTFDFTSSAGSKKFTFKKPGYVTVEFTKAIVVGEEYDFSFTMYKPSTDSHVERGTTFVSWHQHEGTPANAFFIPEYNVDVWWGIGRFKMGLDFNKSENTTKLTKLTVQAKGQNWDCHKVEGDAEVETSAIDIPITISAGGCSNEQTQINVSKVAIYSNGVEVWSDDSNWTSASDPLNSKVFIYSIPNIQVAWNNDFQVKMWARVQKKSVVGTDGDGAGALVGYHLDKKLVTWYPEKPPTTKISTSWGQIGGYFLGILDNPVNIVAGFTDIFTVDQFNQFAMEDNPVGFPD